MPLPCFSLCRLSIAALLMALASLQPAAAQSATAPSAPAPRAAPKAIDSIAAVVNTDVITRKELSDRVKSVEARIRRQPIED